MAKKKEDEKQNLPENVNSGYSETQPTTLADDSETTEPETEKIPEYWDFYKFPEFTGTYIGPHGSEPAYVFDSKLGTGKYLIHAVGSVPAAIQNDSVQTGSVLSFLFKGFSKTDSKKPLFKIDLL